jgi:hypothetical protein
VGSQPWENADLGILFLQQAKAEYAKRELLSCAA